MINGATGSLADVEQARRAALRARAPRWQRLVMTTWLAALFALVSGGSRVSSALLPGLAVGVALLVALRMWQRHQGVHQLRKRRGHLSRGIAGALAASIVVFASVWTAALVIRYLFLPLGSPQAYAAVFVTMFVLWTAFTAVSEKIDFYRHVQAGASSGAEGRLDPVIELRGRLMACAVLAWVKSMRFDLLAKTLGMSEAELAQHISELADAQYVFIRADAKDPMRQWISLSDAGFAAYANHIRALRAAAPV
jgi:hypothetical protein